MKRVKRKEKRVKRNNTFNQKVKKVLTSFLSSTTLSLHRRRPQKLIKQTLPTILLLRP